MIRKSTICVLFCLPAIPSFGETIHAPTNDADIQRRNDNNPPINVTGESNSQLSSGCSGSVNQDRCSVIPIQLPDFGVVADPFSEASFIFNYEGKNNTVAGNVDVYGLGRRGSPVVEADDYWTATDSVDPTDATLLAQDVITEDSTAYGLKTVSNASLVAYLNAQYSGGAGAGAYVFFRLSVDTPQTGGASRYLITSADGGTATTAPRLVYMPPMPSDSGDAEVQLTLGDPPYLVTNETSGNLLVGTAGGLVNGEGKERCVVMPFKLPEFGTEPTPFNNATFVFEYNGKSSTVQGNVDVYGLGRRAASDVWVSDYWTATSEIDPTDATLIAQDVIVENSTSYGLKTVSNASLVDYLNAQYAGGAGAGEYVFLRLGTDKPQTGGANRYFITPTEGAIPETRPRIVYNRGVTPLPTSERPFLWVRNSERAEILAKIGSQSWAQSVYNGMVNRVAGEVAAHQSNRENFIKGLPVIWTTNPPRYKTYPTYSEARDGSEDLFNAGVDCAVLYYLTGDEKYALCAADILHNAVQTLLPVAPSTSVGNGGWALQDGSYGLLYEARVMGTQLPVIYDFLHAWLQANQVYDVDAGGMVDFSFNDAQQVFRTYYELTRDHGSKTTNWSALMATSMVNCLLAFDDKAERDAALQVYLATGSARQASLDFDYRYYGEPGNVWPESLQYASAVGEIRSAHMVMIERYDPDLSLFEIYPNLPLSLPRIRDFRYPSGTEQISFGDGHRSKEGQSFFEYEMIYRHAKERGYDELATLMGGLINGGVADGEYDRSDLRSYASLGKHNEPLQLLLQAPAVTESPLPLELPRTDELPFAGIALQRNESPNGDANHGLMGFVGGGAFVHSHASGMSMELYGMGEVMGTKAGRDDSYSTTLHTDYYRLFAANNTVIVNGASIGDGGWKNLAINTVNTVSMEPQPFESAVSPTFSFTTSSFNDNKGTLAEATQQRTLAIVRTSDTSGFYVDLFRSESSVTDRTATTLDGNVTDQYHDYIYRNIGDLTMTIEADGAPLSLYNQSNRFQNDVGANWAQPGWRYFANTKVSHPHQADLFARFKATPSGRSSVYMDMHMPAISDREVSKTDSPAIKDAPSPYDNRDSPTLVIRKIGEAWDKPFVSVFEPHFGASGGTIQKATALWRSGTVVGVKVESLVGGIPVTHYVFSNPDDNQTYADPSVDLVFQGRFGIVADFGNGEYELYIGDGRSLSYRGYTISSVSGDTEASMVVRPETEPVVTANSGFNVVVPGPDLGPVAHWPLDEGTGTTTANVADLPDPATIRNGATWGSDATRASFVNFDGTDDRISTHFTYALSATDDFTWAWWAKRTAEGSPTAVMVGNRFPQGAPGEEFEFIKFTPAEAEFANTGDSASIDKYDYADIPQNGWHHYAMVKTGTRYQWYVDGLAQGSPVTLSYSETSPIPFNIGGDDDNDIPGGKPGEHFTGSIDDVVLYNRALNSRGVNGLMDGIYEVPTTTALEDWRMLHFGLAENTGNAADSFDANHDGESNLLEFATGQNPHTGTFAQTSTTMNGASLEFRYSRSKAALADGFLFTVEWADSLLSDSWSSAGVSDIADTEPSGVADLQNRVATVPLDSSGRRFLHLRIDPP